jgi:hypothetical protein
MNKRTKQFIAAAAAGLLIGGLCVSCATRRQNNDDGYDRYRRNREAAIDATRRMEDAEKK